MIRIFLIILCLFLAISCARKQDTQTQDSEEAAGQPQEEALSVAATGAEPQQKEKAKGAPEEETEKMRNPFLTQEEEEALKETGTAIPITNLAISAILYSSNVPASSRAIINGRILSVGDSIDNKEVTKISVESVTLKDAQGEYIIQLKKVAGE